MKFVVTVDVEADNQWKRDGSLSLSNLRVLPRFHAVCKKYGFQPTYLITYEVASDQEVMKQLRAWQEAGEAEIGAHLHPWTTPPAHLSDTDNAFPNELDDATLSAKLEELTRCITTASGRAPTSFRAGRWGLDQRMVKMLEKLGYTTDCSVTPFVSWKHFRGLTGGAGGPDFRTSPAHPHRLGAHALVEAPMTILPIGVLGSSRWIQLIFQRLPEGFLKRLLNRLVVRLRWCRIFPETALADLVAVYHATQKRDLPVLQFMIHSSELLAGASPYAKDEDAVEHIFSLLDQFFAYLQQEKCTSATVSEITL